MIFLLCVAMVAVTLHFTPVMNQLASKYPFLIIDFLKILLRIKIGWKYSELKKYTLVISRAWFGSPIDINMFINLKKKTPFCTKLLKLFLMYCNTNTFFQELYGIYSTFFFLIFLAHCSSIS